MLLHEHALNKIGDGERPVAWGRGPGAANRRGRGASHIRCGGKLFGEKRSENFGEHKRVDHTFLLGQENLLQSVFAKTRGNLIAQSNFKATGLSHLATRAAETDLPTEPGDAFITRIGFFQ